MLYPALLGVTALVLLLVAAHLSAWQSEKRRAALRKDAARAVLEKALASEEAEPSLPSLKASLTEILAAYDEAMKQGEAAYEARKSIYGSIASEVRQTRARERTS